MQKEDRLARNNNLLSFVLIKTFFIFFILTPFLFNKAEAGAVVVYTSLDQIFSEIEERCKIHVTRNSSFQKRQKERC